MENTDLVQIRPAFGGNIMAEIITADHRPQMATVRYKVMQSPSRGALPAGQIIQVAVDPALFGASPSLSLSPSLSPCAATRIGVEVLEVVPRQPEQTIDAAEILVVAGRGVKKREDLSMLQRLADLLGGQLACSRPLAEAGWMDAKRQIGLSGRAVRPKLIITCGISGAIQFLTGMSSSELIVAINKDEKAPVMSAAHIAIVGDLYEVVPRLIDRIAQHNEQRQGGISP
jgi:electron transfer flavoprotein alpha subunit